MATFRDAVLQPKGYAKQTQVAATALTVPSGAGRALIKPESFPVRWRDDGVNPTATDGMLIDVGDEFWYTGQIRALRFIDTGAGAATLHVSFYA